MRKVNHKHRIDTRCTQPARCRSLAARRFRGEKLSMKPFLLVPAILLVLSNCTRNANPPQLDSESIKVDVRQMLSSMSDSIGSHGLAGWIPFLYRSPEFTWEFHGVQTSYDSLVQSEQRENPRYRSITLTWDSIQVEPVAPDKATLFSTYSEIVIDTAGKQSTLTGSVEATVIKISGSWKIQRGRTFDEKKTINN